MESLSQQRQLVGLQEVQKEEAQSIQSSSYFTHYIQNPTAFKTKRTDNRIPQKFEEACKIPKWADAIDREYNAMVERKTWEYVKLTPYRRPLPYIWNFPIKDTVGDIIK